MLEKIREVDPPMNPRANNVVALDAGHKTVPLIGVAVEHTAPEGIGIAKAEAIEIKARSAT